MGRGDCSNHLERPLAVGISETPTLGDDLCGSGAGRLLVQVSTYMTMWLKRKAPHLSITHDTQKCSPIMPCPRQMGGDKMTFLLALRWASSGWGPLHQGRHHLPADWDCGVIITCDCTGMLSSVLWLAI